MESPILSNESGAEWQLDLDDIIAGCPRLTAIDFIGGIFCNLCHSTFINKKVFDRHYIEQHNKLIKDIVYTCVVCRREISPYPSFRNHCYLAHVNKNKFKCQYCNKQFSKQSILNNHVDSVHFFRCASCQKQFPTKSELHTHKSIHKRIQNKPPYPCKQCSKAIENVDMCELHIDEHSKILYPCPICNETASSKIETATHLTKHFNEVITSEIITTETSEYCSVDMLGGVLCCYCDELFKDRLDIDLHFINEHSDKEIVYTCNICGKQYNTYYLFANHCHFHASKNKFECVECGKFFARLSLLIVHTEAFHSNGTADEKPFTCMECGHAFGTEVRLRKHLRTVHTINSFTCQEKGCEMVFETPRDLIIHQRKHQICRDNWCRQCGLQFTTLSSCQVHLDTHRKKLYSCPICNKQYREKYLIMKHIPSHFEAILHVCKVCGKAFNARYRLVEHNKIHSEIRNHICTYCGKGFIKPHQLVQHLNIHTGLKPYKCAVCTKTFANYPNWMKHMRKTHKIDGEDLKKLAENNKIPNKQIAAIDNQNIEKNDGEVKSDSGIESLSPEMPIQTYNFVNNESDDSNVESTKNLKIENDWSIINETTSHNSSLHYMDMLPITNITFDSDIKVTSAENSIIPPSTVLPEYGPELTIDDQDLPHIDPLLTIRQDPSFTVPQHSWEPYITKVHDTYDANDMNIISFMNTDIY